MEDLDWSVVEKIMADEVDYDTSPRTGWRRDSSRIGPYSLSLYVISI